MQKGSRTPNDFFLQVLQKKLRKNKDLEELTMSAVLIGGYGGSL